ncbi:MAG: hypothetical protein QM608_16940 [Caulobacter sp.]
MDYEAEFQRQDLIVSGILSKYKEMLAMGDLDDKVYPAITGAIYKIENFKDPFVHNMSGPEYGSTTEALIEGWGIPKEHLPMREELAKALLARALARQRGNLRT